MNTQINIADKVASKNTYVSLIGIVLWAAALIFLPQIIMSFIIGLLYRIYQGAGSSLDTLSSIPLLLTILLLSPVIFIPMLLIATNRKNWDERFGFWAVKVINAKVLVKWLIVGLFFWLISSYLGELLNLPIEQFMLDVKSASNSLGVVILMVVTICLLVPVMEELVFRGWLYSKIAQTKLGNIGALFLSSILFTTIHTQYDNAITLMIIFSLGLLLGGVRYKSGNISYSIAIHILFNSLATIALFFFL
jgi:membrane protease YdiL (CAAX protease family)